MGISVQTLWVLVFRGVNDLPEGSFRRNDPSLTNRIPNGSNGSTKTAACSGWEEPLVTFWFLVSAISSAMERPSLLSPLNGDEKRLTTVPQRTVSLLCETDAKQASVQLLKRQALGVWHADALSDVENAIGDLHSCTSGQRPGRRTLAAVTTTCSASDGPSGSTIASASNSSDSWLATAHHPLWPSNSLPRRKACQTRSP